MTPQTQDNRGSEATEASQTPLAASTAAIAALDDSAVTIDFSRAITCRGSVSISLRLQVITDCFLVVLASSLIYRPANPSMMG